MKNFKSGLAAIYYYYIVEKATSLQKCYLYLTQIQEFADSLLKCMVIKTTSD